MAEEEKITIIQRIKNRFRRDKSGRPKIRVKTPTVLQMEAVECGAASLGIILGYYGRIVSLEELRVACGVSRDGVNARNIVQAARSYGLAAKGFRRDPDSVWANHTLPIIIHWNFDHFLVLEGADNKFVYLNDPAVGPRKVLHEEFDDSFTGILLQFSQTEDFQKGGKKTNILQAMRPRLRKSGWALAYVLMASLALVVPGFLIPTFSRIFVDFYLIRGLDNWLQPLLIGLALTAVLRAILTWIQQRYLLRLETKLAVTNSGQFFWHLLQLPIEFFNQRSPGEISTRVEMNDRVASLLSGELATALLNIILVFFYTILMFQYSVTLTLIGIVFASFNLITLRYIARQRRDTNQRLLRERGQMLATAFSGLQSLETLKATGSESEFFQKWSGYQAKVVTAEQEFGISTQVVTAVPPLLSGIITITILAIGGLAVMAGDLTIGMLVAFQSLMASFLAPVNQLINLAGQLQEVEGILVRLDDVFQYQPDARVKIVDQDIEDVASITKLTGTVELKDITFGYSRLAPPLIQAFNLKLEPGKRIALVGASGSGKSTIAKLITGLYAPWEGQILFANQEREEIPGIILNSSVSSVDQEIFLFEGTIKDNLTMWNDRLAEADIIQAAKDAHIHEVITNRPNGYNSRIEEGGRNFSGGQRQRLEIARALVNNPTILVLDEATSALDSVTEQIIDNNLRRRGCTCVIVAHRLSTIRDCDEIIVLDNGQVVERGSHQNLWRQRGHYYQLIQAESSQSDLLVESLWESITNE